MDRGRVSQEMGVSGPATVEGRPARWNAVNRYGGRCRAPLRFMNLNERLRFSKGAVAFRRAHDHPCCFRVRSLAFLYCIACHPRRDDPDRPSPKGVPGRHGYIRIVNPIRVDSR